MTRFFGIDKDIRTKTKENIYKVVIAATELSKTKTGALIVLERDYSLRQYIDRAKKVYAEITSDLLISIFLLYWYI